MRYIITKTSSLKSVFKKLWVTVKANSFNNDSTVCEMTLLRGKRTMNNEQCIIDNE